jgi:dihydroorotase
MMNSDHIVIRKPDDFHLHLRQGSFMRRLAPYTAAHFGRALIMPNTDPPVCTADDAVAYRNEILSVVPEFDPLMTIKLVPYTTRDMILHAHAVGVIAGKLYPQGVTHNSADGVSDIRKLYPVFAAMSECGMVLSLHAEVPGKDVYCLDREEEFIDTLYDIVDEFPRLRIVVEHVTTAKMVEAVYDLSDMVAATITVHHLFLTTNDVMDGKLQPHNYCLPVAKRPEDRTALQKAALSGSRKFFLGTDSAPHSREAKECPEGCAGIFTAPVAMQLLAKFFDERQALPRLEAYTSEYGAKFYGLRLNSGKLTLQRVDRSPTIPPMIQGVVPFWQGKTLPWIVVPS